MEELLFPTKIFDSVSNGTLEIETEDGYDAANAMNSFFLFSFSLVFVSVSDFVIGDWNFVVDCLRYTRRTKQCF